MIPISVSLKNYKSYGNQETTLELSGEAVRLVSGDTGSGKTSFVDAIIWCLYGYSLCKVDEVVNRQTNKNCKVEFNFQSGNDLYSVIRYRKHEEYGNNVVIFKNNKNVSPKKNAQDYIEGVVGVGYKAFISAVIFSSEIYISLLRSKGADRLKIFESILSLAIVNKWGDISRKELKAVEEKLALVQGEIDKIDYGVDTIKNSIKDYKEKAAKTLMSLKEQKARWEEGLEERKRSIEEYSHIDVEAEIKKNEEFDKVEQENALINQQIKEIEEELEESPELEELSGLRLKSQRTSKIVNSVNLEEELKAIKENNEAKEKFEEQIRELQLLHKEVARLNKEEKELNDRIANLEQEEWEIKNKLNEIDSGVCPTCNRPFAEHEDGFEDTRKEIKKEWETKTEAIETEKTKLQRKTGEIEEVQLKLNELGLEVNKFEEKVFDYTEEELKEAFAENDRILKRITELENLVEDKDNRNRNRKEKIRTLRQKLIDITHIKRSEYSTEFLNGLNEKLEEVKEDIQEIEKQIISINDKASSVYDKTYVEDLALKIDKLKEAEKKAEKKREKKEFTARHYKLLTSIFSNKKDGIKKFIISKMIKLFNEQVNIYVPLFFSDYKDEISISFNDDLSETIMVGGKEVSLDTFSSGEKTRFEIAMTLSLFFLAKIFFASSVKFVVFDELLDKNLDEKSLSKVLDVIKETSRTNSVLIISHRQDLKDEFANHILISKDKNGFSKMKEIQEEVG